MDHHYTNHIPNTNNNKHINPLIIYIKWTITNITLSPKNKQTRKITPCILISKVMCNMVLIFLKINSLINCLVKYQVNIILIILIKNKFVIVNNIMTNKHKLIKSETLSIPQSHLPTTIKINLWKIKRIILMLKITLSK